jgi:hypothetical protein
MHEQDDAGRTGRRRRRLHYSPLSFNFAPAAVCGNISGPLETEDSRRWRTRTPLGRAPGRRRDAAAGGKAAGSQPRRPTEGRQQPRWMAGSESWRPQTDDSKFGPRSLAGPELVRRSVLQAAVGLQPTAWRWRQISPNLIEATCVRARSGDCRRRCRCGPS